MKLTNKHINRLNVIIEMSIDRASRTLSKTLKTASVIKISYTSVRDSCSVTERLNSDEREMIGTLLAMEGVDNGKILFMVEKEDAYVLKDLYLREPVGTTTEYDLYVESAVKEIGNILSGSICNSIASDLGLTILPLPPLVTCDYAGTIFSAMIMDELFEDDDLLLMDTLFEIMHYNFKCFLYFIPGKEIIACLDKDHLG